LALINEIGNRYGKLTVIERSIKKRSSAYWVCKCDCGNETLVSGGNLRHKITESCGCILKEMFSGSNHPNWKGGISYIGRMLRNTPVYDKWRVTVFKLYNFKCVRCNNKRNIKAHHIAAFNSNVDLRLSITNGICLCEKCHSNFHSLYGSGDNTLYQMSEYLR